MVAGGAEAEARGGPTRPWCAQRTRASRSSPRHPSTWWSSEPVWPGPPEGAAGAPPPLGSPPLDRGGGPGMRAPAGAAGVPRHGTGGPLPHRRPLHDRLQVSGHGFCVGLTCPRDLLLRFVAFICLSGGAANAIIATPSMAKMHSKCTVCFQW